jgi:hypothetical protein
MLVVVVVHFYDALPFVSAQQFWLSLLWLLIRGLVLVEEETEKLFFLDGSNHLVCEPRHSLYPIDIINGSKRIMNCRSQRILFLLTQ